VHQNGREELLGKGDDLARKRRKTGGGEKKKEETWKNTKNIRVRLKGSPGRKGSKGVTLQRKKEHQRKSRGKQSENPKKVSQKRKELKKRRTLLPIRKRKNRPSPESMSGKLGEDTEGASTNPQP